MKSVKYLLLMVGLFSFGEIKAQVNLRLDSNSLAGLPNTINMGSAYIDSVTIYNDSSAAFLGIINFRANINGDSIIADTSQISTLYYSHGSTIDSIAPNGGHITRVLIINVTNPPFIIGSSGVVIWPIASNSAHFVYISDSISKVISVLYPVGINEVEDTRLKVYLVGQQLTIQTEGVNLLKNVRLYDVAGNLLQENKISASAVINMDRYAAGVYFAEINFADNTRKVVKLFNR